eukprot:CAMPEP_0119412540 /NCGR_PEP_ID=MMETSP1335-20130426/4946_1 /TAXON_ID=259385 /ORGANISM="Chrysoculter rhomboideus, Strain RCC1486" /LENGTH=290 /DNA_ID=CAMNT_0007437289 /DNA_START=27 /DNA_END=899 /DNA_ORIENTATION=+
MCDAAVGTRTSVEAPGEDTVQLPAHGGNGGSSREGLPSADGNAPMPSAVLHPPPNAAAQHRVAETSIEPDKVVIIIRLHQDDAEPDYPTMQPFEPYYHRAVYKVGSRPLIGRTGLSTTKHCDLCRKMANSELKLQAAGTTMKLCFECARITDNAADASGGRTAAPGGTTRQPSLRVERSIKAPSRYIEQESQSPPAAQPAKSPRPPKPKAAAAVPEAPPPSAAARDSLVQALVAEWNAMHKKLEKHERRVRQLTVELDGERTEIESTAARLKEIEHQLEASSRARKRSRA